MRDPIPTLVSQNWGYQRAWPEMVELMAACFESGQLTNNGVHVRQFEVELAQYLRVPADRIVVMDHGQSAIVLALKQLALPDRSYVAVPDLTFTGTVSAVIAAGHVPVLAPVDANSLMLTPATLDRARQRFDIKAAVVVEYVGLPCERHALSEYCREHEVELIFDSAAAFGAELPSSDQDKPSTEGAFVAPADHFYCYSFHATKTLAAVEGGALYCPSSEAALAVREMRAFGLSPHDRLVTNRPGFNAKLSELHAIVGRYNLRWYGEAVEQRRAMADDLALRLAQDAPQVAPELLRPVTPPAGARPVWWFIPYVFRREAIAHNPRLPAEFREAINRAGIGVTNNYYPVQHFTPAFRDYPWFDGWEHDLAERLVLFPCRPDLTASDAAYMVEQVVEAARALWGR